MEFFIAWYSGDPYERWVFGHRLFGHTYWFMGWTLIAVNVCVTQLLWFKKIRANADALFIIGVLINIACGRNALSSWSLAISGFSAANWGLYIPTIWDIALYIGSLACSS